MDIWGIEIKTRCAYQPEDLELVITYLHEMGTFVDINGIYSDTFETREIRAGTGDWRLEKHHHHSLTYFAFLLAVSTSFNRPALSYFCLVF
ncbi:hypothetical protein LWI28_018607 [Acer negundo]|uniref:Uncharacterized protein n=1 Tax=Acer negundo TaxID=4023 RepID=A0AAD5I6Q3_ACENE|nr:hypothetical protein LWI28_018607 [Acer negundo]